jgi:hypothetical protein
VQAVACTGNHELKQLSAFAGSRARNPQEKKICLFAAFLFLYEIFVDNQFPFVAFRLLGDNINV